MVIKSLSQNSELLRPAASYQAFVARRRHSPSYDSSSLRVLVALAWPRNARIFGIGSMFFVTLIAAAGVTQAGGALPVEPRDVLQADLVAVPEKLVPGQQGTLEARLRLAPKHWAYEEKFEVQVLKNADWVRLGRPELSPRVEFFDKVSGKKKMGAQGQATLSIPFELSDAVPQGEQILEVGLIYQACTSEYCLLPQELRLKTALVVNGPLVSEHKPHGAELKSDWAAMLASGWIKTIFFAFFAGVVASLTPCIYPMIPITLAIIGSRGGHTSHWRGFRLSLVYVIGIAITYASLGLLAASTGALFGSALGSPWVTATVAGIMVAMSLSLFGLFELQPPAWITQNLTKKRVHGGGWVSVLVAGMVAGVIASPCVSPVLVSLLTFIAQSQNHLLGFILLFVFALGLGMLLLAVGTFGGLTSRLPRSGPWMVLVKEIMGFALLAVAWHTVEPLVPESLHPAILSGAVLMITSWLGAFAPAESGKISQLRLSLLRLGWMVGAVGLSLWLWQTYQQPKGSDSGTPTVAPAATQTNQVAWEPLTEGKLATARKQGLPVLIDFWADWCEACHELEQKTFSDREVQQVAERFLMLKLDATQSSHQVREWTRRFGVVGLPTLILIDANGDRREELTVTGFEPPAELLKRMRTLLR